MPSTSEWAGGSGVVSVEGRLRDVDEALAILAQLQQRDWVELAERDVLGEFVFALVPRRRCKR